MPIKIGSNDACRLYIGSQQIIKIYIGSIELCPQSYAQFFSAIKASIVP